MPFNSSTTFGRKLEILDEIGDFGRTKNNVLCNIFLLSLPMIAVVITANTTTSMIISIMTTATTAAAAAAWAKKTGPLCCSEISCNVK